jgi:hypothetical protein
MLTLTNDSERQPSDHPAEVENLERQIVEQPPAQHRHHLRPVALRRQYTAKTRTSVSPLRPSTAHLDAARPIDVSLPVDVALRATM